MAQQEVQVTVTGKDNVSPVLTGVSGKLELLKARVEGNRAAMGKLRDTFKDVAKDSLGASGAMGQFAESLFEVAGSAGPAALITFASLAVGIGTVVKSIQDAKTANEEFAKSQSNLNIILTTFQNEALGAIKKEDEMRETSEKATAALEKQGRVVDQLSTNLAGVGAGMGSISGPSAQLTRATILQTELRTKANNAEAAYVQQLGSTLGSVISQYNALKELNKILGENKERNEELAQLEKYLVQVSNTGNATRRLAALNALKEVEAKKEVNKATTEEIDLLAKANSLRILSTQQLVRYNKLLDGQRLILNSNTSSIEDKIKAQERLNADDRQTKELANELEENLKRVSDAYREQVSALKESVNIGIRSDDLTKKLTDSLGKEEDTLKTLVPLTAEWVEQTKLVTELRERLAQSRTLNLDDSREDVEASITRAREEQAAMLSMITEGVGTPDMFAALGQQLLGLQTIYQNTQDIIQKGAISGEIKAINDALTNFATNTNQYKTLETVINLTVESFTLLAQSIGQGARALPAFGRAFAQMISSYARNKAALMIGESLEQLAKGIAAATNPFTAPLAGGYFASAGKFAAAAAAFGVISGGAANIGGAGGQNAATGFVRSNFGEQTVGAQGNITIVFPEGLVDMSNPRTQREFADAFNTVAGNRLLNFAGA